MNVAAEDRRNEQREDADGRYRDAGPCGRETGCSLQPNWKDDVGPHEGEIREGDAQRSDQKIARAKEMQIDYGVPVAEFPRDKEREADERYDRAGDDERRADPCQPIA